MPKRTRAIKVTDNKKSWNTKGKKKSYTDKITKTKSFLIVCEGKNTEPAYFKSFPVVTADVKGGCGQRVSVVNHAIKLAESSEYKGYEVWCVFDMDFKGDNSKIKQEFNEAIKLAQHGNIKIAYSNDAFELWIILHFQYFEINCLRHEYYKILSTYWGINYEKKGKEFGFCKELYEKLENDDKANQAQAIRWAKKLRKKHEVDNTNYADRNPCTTVYELVEELNQYLKP